MKAIVSKSDIADAVSAVSAVIPARSTQPVLANLLLAASGNTLTVVGTDKEQSLYVSIPAEVPIPGSFAVPAKKLGEVLRELADGDVELVLEEYALVVSQGKRKVRLPGMPSEDFPPTELLKSPQLPFELEKQMLSDFIGMTSYAVSSEITRINLCGLLWQLFPQEMRMVATDGHMLALVKKPMELGLESPLEMLIPERAVAKLSSILSKSAVDTVKITPGEDSVQFETDNFRFQTRLIAEKFPDYERVLPLENDVVMVADLDELVRAVRLMSVVTTPVTSLVKFTFSEGSLELFASDLDAGTEGSVALAVDYENEPMSVGFNAKMLLEILRHIPTEQVRFAMKSPSTACLITPLPQPEDFEYIAVIMPLRL